MAEHLEVERKYDVEPDTPVPSLDGLPGVGAAAPPLALDLEAAYYDTEDLALADAGVTLRRRIGGKDDGWHLKLPAGQGDREEIEEPLGEPDVVPDRLRALVQVHVRGRDLRRVATVRNHRVVYRLLDADRTELAELCDDHVTAEAPMGDGSVTTSSWREWEVELAEGPRTLLDAADAVVRAAGARPAGIGSKLARALDRPAAHGRALLEREPSIDGPAGVVVLAHLREQVGQLKEHDPRVRRDQPDAVHKMRVATRRLRGALATFKPLLDRETTAGTRRELRWLGGVLGEARDAEVMRDRMEALVDEDGSGGADGPGGGADGTVGDRLDHHMRQRYRDAHSAVLEVLSSPRYFALLDGLDRLTASPPWAAPAQGRAAEVLPPLVRREWRRVRKRASAVEQAGSAEERDLALHELRKAAKRLRYACEALAPVFGTPAAKLAAAAEEVQEVLGDHQDSRVSQDLLHELAGRGALPSEDVLVLGRLHLLEQAHAERRRDQFQRSWRRLARKRRRRWLAEGA